MPSLTRYGHGEMLKRAGRDTSLRILFVIRCACFGDLKRPIALCLTPGQTHDLIGIASISDR
ncbi:hypothetical protein [Celeribacter sp. ULVN23_4]